MSYAPQRLLELRALLKPLTGLGDNELGIVGDPNHNGGYHNGWDRRRIVDGRLADYSWTESPRDSGHRTDAAAAFDLGYFDRLREFSVWAVKQCEANAPDTLDLREIIYSTDGLVVKRWDRLGKRTGGDSSHLKHTHFSWFRDAEDRDKTALFRRFFGLGEETTEMLTRCKLGDKGQAVLDLQEAIVLRGGSVGAKNDGSAMIDGDYGQKTAAGLAALVGGDGSKFGIDELFKLFPAGNGVPGPAGPAGPPGPAGATPTRVRVAEFVAEVVEVA